MTQQHFIHDGRPGDCVSCPPVRFLHRNDGMLVREYGILISSISCVAFPFEIPFQPLFSSALAAGCGCGNCLSNNGASFMSFHLLSLLCCNKSLEADSNCFLHFKNLQHVSTLLALYIHFLTVAPIILHSCLRSIYHNTTKIARWQPANSRKGPT